MHTDFADCCAPSFSLSFALVSLLAKERGHCDISSDGNVRVVVIIHLPELLRRYVFHLCVAYGDFLPWLTHPDGSGSASVIPTVR